MQTRREQIIDFLQKMPCTLEDITRFFEIPFSLAWEDIQHIQKSTKKDYNFVITPAKCERCGFIFQEKKCKKPSRCPKCKNERLTASRMQLFPKS